MTPSLKIVTVLHSPDFMWGTERTAHLAAAALREAGHRVYLLHDQPTSPEVAVEYDGAAPAAGFFDTRSYFSPMHREARRRAATFLNVVRPDVVHIHAYPRTAHIRWLANAYRTFATVHVPLCPNGARYQWKPGCSCDRKVGLGCFTHGYMSRGCGRLGNGMPMSPHAFARSMYDNRQLTRALGECAGLVVPSRWMADRLIADGADPSRMRVIPPPIAAPAEANKPQAPPVVLYVGRLAAVKGVRDLIEASAQIRLPHELWVVGDGPERERLVAAVDKCRLAHRVRFFGTQPPARIDELRSAATIAVVPSRWPETFCMVGPEAMATGLPTIAYRSGAIPEWLDDGVTGFLLEPGDVQGLCRCVEQLLSDEPLRRRMADAASGVAQKWNVRRHRDRLLEMYAGGTRQGDARLPVAMTGTEIGVLASNRIPVE